MLIKKDEGIINEIVYNNTVYNNGKYRKYLNIIELKKLILEIIASNATTDFVRFTPFYRDHKLKWQTELDEYMFFFQCKDQVIDKVIWEQHIAECSGYPIYKKYSEMSADEVRLGKILYPLCKSDDIDSYQKSFKIYYDFVDEHVCLLMEEVKHRTISKAFDLSPENICFEVHSK